ncbi:TlpA disulfide reductase family protein [uncultured Kriegella sp.]|uniref:TlpA family protein disulfide reductase n=1 Tax=uncultured Kriegella sp. TaxID=1798910 RepID=UPI0030DBCA17|tara:strand:+ start:5822 stop:7312 length:1491 start_codon:yes stop_codon:yes gene_type:complete
MKLQRIILLILIVGLSACSKKNEEIIINVKVIGGIPDKIEYTIPVNGTWFYGAKKSVVPDSLGNFRISIASDLASFITLYIPKKAAAVLLVEPDQKYEVDFNLDSKNKAFKVNGENNEALTLYNSLPLPEFYVLSTSNPLLKDAVLSSVSSKIENLKEKEISQFKKQLEKQIITKDFYDLAELDRNYYYLALETSIAKVKYNAQSDSIETQNTQIRRLWTKIFQQTPPTESFDIRSPWSFILMRNYINFNQHNAGILKSEEMQKIYDQGKIHSYNIGEAKKYLKGKALEYYHATYILSNSFSNKDNSKELIALYENFKKEYPNSAYSNHLTGLIKPIIDFHQKIEESTNNNKIEFIKNYENIDRFDELIKTLKGKKLFVDIWGTWCAPCKKEFQQKDRYSELLKSKNITTLYICEGINSKEKVWKEMINYYDLEGQHLLANRKLIADIIDKFGNKGSFAYPRYLLVDEKGNVVNSQASYPSKTEQLENEINENYVW